VWKDWECRVLITEDDFIFILLLIPTLQDYNVIGQLLDYRMHEELIKLETVDVVFIKQ
jgi:hypothetical protein